jgi:hypothetical protein
VEALERDIGHAMARQEATGAALRACRAAAEQTAARNADRKRAREREEEVGSLIASHREWRVLPCVPPCVHSLRALPLAAAGIALVQLREPLLQLRFSPMGVLC